MMIKIPLNSHRIHWAKCFFFSFSDEDEPLVGSFLRFVAYKSPSFHNFIKILAASVRTDGFKADPEHSVALCSVLRIFERGATGKLK